MADMEVFLLGLNDVNKCVTRFGKALIFSTANIHAVVNGRLTELSPNAYGSKARPT